MKTIILQSENEKDINKLMSLANRLGVFVSLPPTPKDLEDEPAGNTDTLYEGLGLDGELKTISLEEFENQPLYNEKYVPDTENAQMYFGAWADDENETLEELLNMLTP